MSDYFLTSSTRGIYRGKGLNQGPPLISPAQDLSKLNIFSAEPPLEKLAESQSSDHALISKPVDAGVVECSKAANGSTYLVNEFYREGVNISVAARELLSAMRNIFSGEDYATKRRLDRTLKILCEVRCSLVDECRSNRECPAALQELLEKAIRDTEACLGHAEAAEMSAAAKKAHEAHCHIAEILGMLI
jgi:hypothetical protein